MVNQNLIIDITDCPYTGLKRKLELVDITINYIKKFILTTYKIGYWNANNEFIDYNMISSRVVNPTTGKLNFERGKNVEFKIDNETRIDPNTGSIIDLSTYVEYEQIPLPIQYTTIELPQEYDEEGNPLPIQYQTIAEPQQFITGPPLPLNIEQIGIGEFDFYQYLFDDFNRLLSLNITSFKQIVLKGTLDALNRGRLN